MTQLMTFSEHLQELKRKLLIFGIIFVVAEIINFTIAASILNFLAQTFSLISIEPLDAFNSTILISLVLTLLAAYPIGLIFLLDFIKSAFNTIKPIFKIFLASTILFYAGFFFGSIAFSGLLSILAKQFAADLGIQTFWSAFAFTKFVFMNGLIFAFLFQLPLIVLLGLKFNLIDEKKLLKNSWFAVPIIFLFSGWLTPPDPLSLFLMAIPLCAMFYGSIIISVKLKKWSVI